MSLINKSFLLLSTADWDNPFWTNKQHVAVELSRLGYNVLYVDSLGIRSPSLNKADVSRIFRRLLKGLRPPRKVADNLWVWSPIIIPFQKYRLVRFINKILLSFFTRLFIFFLGFKNKVVWTYNPMTLDLLYVTRSTYLVYHCVDDVKQQPGMPKTILASAEYDLLKRADCVFVTSNELYRTRKKINSNTYLFTNVADYEHFSKARDSETLVPDDIAQIKHPVIGFVGAISAYKLDFKLIAYMARQRPDWSIVLIGKVGEGDPNTDVSSLTLDNIYLLGPRAYEQLPAYMKGFDVAMIPVVLNEYTHAMFPMKFFEYLAAGRRIVSMNIDSLQSYSDYTCIANSYDEFVSRIDEILASGSDDNLDNRLELARQNTYKIRMKKMLEVMKVRFSKK